MNQSILPDEMEASGIVDMLPGEEAYTLPWAITVTEDGRMWINGNYPFEYDNTKQQAFGQQNFTCKITRTSHGVQVDHQSIRNEKYDKSPTPWGHPALPVELI